MILKTPATIDDLRHVPDDGRVYELVDGAIIVTPAGMRHANVAARITTALSVFVHGNDLGEVYTEGVGIELPTGNVRSPDVSYVQRAKLPGGRSPMDFGRLVPDLVAEVLSPSDNVRDTARKTAEYLECGVPVVWIVDPDARTVTVHTAHGGIARYGGDEVISAESVLPGFACRVSDFFPPPLTA